MFDQQANNNSDNKWKNNLSNVFTFLYFVGIYIQIGFTALT